MRLRWRDHLRGLRRHDLEAKIVKRCWADEEFRAEFIADPAAAFAKYLRISAARLPTISVHQETADCWHIVLPAKPASASELADAELEKIAAGVGGPAWLEPWLEPSLESSLESSLEASLESWREPRLDAGIDPALGHDRLAAAAAPTQKLGW